MLHVSNFWLYRTGPDESDGVLTDRQPEIVGRITNGDVIVRQFVFTSFSISMLFRRKILVISPLPPDFLALVTDKHGSEH